MGLMNWTLNRGLDNKLIWKQTNIITVRATDPVTLNKEIAKYMNKGYVCSGNPYTAVEYGTTTFYQTMIISQEAVDQINAQAEAQKQARAESRAKRIEMVKKGFNWVKKQIEDSRAVKKEEK